jgi:Domain of unknown function (DUF4258)
MTLIIIAAIVVASVALGWLLASRSATEPEPVAFDPGPEQPWEGWDKDQGVLFLTDHAKDRMAQQDITLDDVRVVLANPTHTAALKTKGRIKTKGRTPDGRLVSVVTQKGGDGKHFGRLVITSYWDDRDRYKWARWTREEN